MVSRLKQGNEMGFVKRKGNSSRTGEKRRRWHCGKFHLAGTLTGRLGGQTTSISAQILRGALLDERDNPMVANCVFNG